MSTSASTMIMRISELELLLVCSHLSSILYQRLRRCVMLVVVRLPDGGCTCAQPDNARLHD